MDSLVGWNDEFAVEKPEAGEQVTVTPSEGQGLDLTAIAALDAQFYQTGSNLWIVFEDGAILVVEGYFEGSSETADGTPRSVVVDGEPFTGEEFLTAFAIDELPEEFAEGETGDSGPQQNSATFDDPALGDLGPNGQGLGLLGNTNLSRDGAAFDEEGGNQDTDPTLGVADIGAVDDDDLVTDGQSVFTGSLAVDFGNNDDDTPDGADLQDTPTGFGDRSITFDSADVGSAVPLSSGGTPLTFTLSNGGTVLTASAGGVTVFEVSLFDDGAGSYRFTLFEPLDHPDATSEDDLGLTFSFTATDDDGDSVSGTFLVNVNDDVPEVGEAPSFEFFNQDFETATDAESSDFVDDTNGWEGSVEVFASGTGGIVTQDGGQYALVQQSNDASPRGPFTRFDGYKTEFNGGFVASVDIYLDPSALNAGEGFDYSLAANDQDGNHQRDFIFHVTKDSSTGQLLIGGSNNTDFDPKENLEAGNNAEVTDSGWYTFEHVFRDAGDGTLAVDLNVYDSNGTLIFTETRNDVSDLLLSEIGGNRYGWFTNIDVPGGIAIDNVQLRPADGLALVDEDDLPAGTDDTKENLAVTGELAVDWGADDADNDALAGATGDRTLTFDAALDGATAPFTADGNPIIYTLSADGTVLTASSGGTDIFTVELNDDDAGSYTFTLLEAFDHPSSGEDIATLDFDFVAKDSDGDTATGSFSVAVKDDVPIATGARAFTVDEDRLPEGTDADPNRTSGTRALGIAWGADDDLVENDTDTVGRRLAFVDENGAAITAPVQNVVLQSTATYRGVELTDALTSDGVPILFDVQEGPNGGQILIAYKEGGDPANPDDQIARITLDPTSDTGSYTFELLGNIDHPDEAGVTSEFQPIVFEIDFAATDSDGDEVKDSFTVEVQDDQPEGQNPRNVSFDEDRVSPDGNDFDPGQAANKTEKTASLRIDWGADDDTVDGPGDTVGRTLTFVDGAGEPVVGGPLGQNDLDLRIVFRGGGTAPSELSSNGIALQFVIVTTDTGGQILTAYRGDPANGEKVFVVELDPTTDTGSYTVTLLDNIDHADPDSGSNRNSVEIEVGFQAFDADGDALKGRVDDPHDFKITIFDDEPEASGTVLTLDVNEADLDTDLSSGTNDHDTPVNGPPVSVMGTLTDVVAGGADQPLSFALELTDLSDSLTGLTSQGELLSYSISGNILTAKAGGRGVFTFEVNPNTGEFTFTLNDQLDHFDTVLFTTDSNNNPVPVDANQVAEAGDTVLTAARSLTSNIVTFLGRTDDSDALFRLSNGNDFEVTWTLNAPGGGEDFTVTIPANTALIINVGDVADGLGYNVIGNDSPGGTASTGSALADVADVGEGDALTIDLSSAVTVTDGDGDSLALDDQLIITINDDAPVIDTAAIENGTVEEEQPVVIGDGNEDTGPNPEDADFRSFFGLIFNDETTEVASGALGVNVGADDIGSLSFGDTIANLEGQNLTSRGKALSYVIIDGPDGPVLLAYTGTSEPLTVPDNPQDAASAGIVFGVGLEEIDSGFYEFVLVDTLDHPDPSGEDTLALDIEFVATDADGDTATGSFTVDVIDDRPVVDGPTPILGNPRFVEEEDLDGGNEDAEPFLPDGVSALAGRPLTDKIVQQDLNIRWGADDADTDDTLVNGILIQDAGAAGQRSLVFADTVEAPAGLTSGGDAVRYAVSADGTRLIAYIGAEAEYDAISDDQVVFTVDLSDDDSGSYTFVLKDTLDHPDAGTDPSDEESIFLEFDFVAKDGDGDSDTDSFTVGVVDDSPVVADTAVSVTVDEDDIDNLLSTGSEPFDGDGDGSLSIPALLGLGFAAAVEGSAAAAVNFGADGPASVGAFSFTSSVVDDMEALELTSKGGDLSYEVIGDFLVAYVDREGGAEFNPLLGDRPVFSLQLDEDTGEFVFRQYDQLDHVDGDGENTQLQSGTDSIDAIDFGAVIDATDGDGDTVNLAGKVLVTITDDVPVVDLYLDGSRALVDESPGPQGDDTNSASVRNLFNGVADQGSDANLGAPQYARDDVVDWDIVGTDEPRQSSLPISVVNSLSITDSASGLKTTIGGYDITLVEENGLIVGRYDDGSGTPKAAFAVHIDDEGQVSIVQYVALEHDDPTRTDESIGLDGKVDAVLTVTDHDGDTVVETLAIGERVRFDDDAPDVDSSSNARIVIDDDDVVGANGNPGFGDNPTDGADSDSVPRNVTGTLDLSFGADGGSVAWDLTDTQATTGGADGLRFETDSDGSLLIIQEQDGSDVTVVTITLDSSNGDYTVTQNNPLIHRDDPNDRENNQNFELAYRVTDGDGDTVDGTIDLRLDDDTPTAVPFEINTMRIISDDDTVAGANGNPGGVGDSGEYNQTNKSLQFSVGADGGTVAWDAGSSTSDGGAAGITFSVDGAGSLLIFQDQGGVSVQIAETTLNEDTGAYTYTQTANLLHDDDGNNDENEAAFTLAFTVTDGDGDTADGKLTLLIDDDTPSASFSGRITVTEDADPSTGDFVVQSAAGTMVFEGGADGAEVTSIAYQSGTVGGKTAIIDGDAASFTRLALTSGGEDVTVEQTDGLTLTGKTGSGDIVFTVVVTNPETGAYEFTQFMPLDHPDTGESGSADPLRMKIGFTVTDGDGDTASQSLQIDINDDAPVIGDPIDGEVAEQTTVLPLDNSSFEDRSLASGEPGIVIDSKGNYTLGSPDDWAIDGQGGLFAPVDSISDTSGHAGDNVVWLRQGATLSQDSGEDLAEGANYSVSLNVGDRTDQSWPGGEIRLVAVDGSGARIVLASLTLPTPADGDWSSVRLETGPISAANVGSDLIIEVQQDAAGGGNQILVDNIQLTRFEPVFDTQTLDINWGADSADDTDGIDNSAAPGTNRSVAFSGSNSSGLVTTDKSDPLTSNGLEVTVASSIDASGNPVLTGSTTEGDVFRITLDDDGTGSYRFELFDHVDHDIAAGPDPELALTFGFTATDSDGDTVTDTFTVTVNDDAPVINLAASDVSGSVDEPGSLAGIVDANASGGLEPIFQANVNVNAALLNLQTSPEDVVDALTTVQSELGVDTPTALAIVWDYLDDSYVSAGPNQPNINEAFVRLGVEYAKYLEAGGTPLLDVVAKFTPDSASDAGDVPDRQQPLHDNLLGNLNSSSLNSRFGGPLLDELTDLIESVNPELLNRDVFSGDEGTSDAAVRQFDVDNGYEPIASGRLVADDDDIGATLTWDAASPNGTYGTFSIDAGTGEWTYVLDSDRPATEALEDGDTPVETFAVTVTDEFGAQDIVTVSVTVNGSADTPVGVNMLIVDSADLLGGFTTIQDAVDAASAGDVIFIVGRTGEYAENVVVNKPLSFKSIDVGEGGAVIAPTSGTAVFLDGTDFGGGDVKFDGVDLVGSGTALTGIDVEQGSNVGTLSFINGVISGFDSRGIWATDNGAPSTTPTMSNLVILNVTFSDNGTGSGNTAHVKLFGYDGDATFENVSFAGTTGVAGPAGRPDNAVEIVGGLNAPSNANPVPANEPDIGTVVLTNVTVTGGYEKNPIAFFNFNEIDGLSITDLDLSGAESNWGPLFNIDGAADAVIDASGFGITFPATSDIHTNIQGDKDGQPDVGQEIIGTDANDFLRGRGGDDTLEGGVGNDFLVGDDFAPDPSDGVDTAVFNGVLDADDITSVADVLADVGAQPGWQVDATAFGEGTDTLFGVEIVQAADPDGAGGSTGRVLLVGSGGFATIQEAVDAANEGDTILIAPGTYNENVVVTTANLTILGVKAGVAGDDGTRGTGESLLTGMLRFAPGSNGGTVNGLQILQGGAAVGALAAVYIQADDITVTNMLMERTGDFDDYRGVVTAIGDAQGLDVSASKITGFATGIFINPGSDATINGNVLEANNVGLSNDGPDASDISGNSFIDNVLEQIGIGVQNPGATDVGGFVNGNTFTGSAPEVSIYDLNAGNQTITGTEADDIIWGGAGVDTLTGGAGDDTFIIGDLSDVDIITDYTSGEDRIDLTALLAGVTLTEANKDEYVRVQGGVLQIDADGGGNSFVDAATLNNVGATQEVSILDDTGEATAIELSITAS